MVWGLLVAAAGAVCAGVAAVLQALAAQAVPRSEGLRFTLIFDLLRQWRFLAGIGMDLLSFIASFAALRVLPIFMVQACSAAALAVTAVIAWRVLGTRLQTREKIAVVAVSVGLVALGLSAATQGVGHGTTAMHVGALVAVGVMALLAVGAARLPGRVGATLLGVLAGLFFGLVNIASRLLPSMAPLDILLDPAFYAMPAAGLCALLCYNTALQRESVVATASGTLIGQTTLPAVAGIVLLGDTTRPGWNVAAVAGFFVAVAGALVLARFGDVSQHVEEPTPAPA